MSWWRVLIAGGLLWVAAVLVTGVTGNFNLVPTVVLLGSFLVPVTAVIWYLDHYQSPYLTGRIVFNGFVFGGVLGLLGAALLESWLLARGPLAYVSVGLIEEAAKLAALVVVAWNVPRVSTRDGVVLGAAVGFGFAALESSGYALTALFASSAGLSLGALVETELIRGVLAPFGHGLWTAILGGVFFATVKRGRFGISKQLILAFLGVSLLHAFWDSMRGIALVLTALITASSLRAVRTPEGVVLVPTPYQANVFTAIDLAGYGVISLAGVLWLVVMWTRSARAESRQARVRELA